PRRIHPPAHRRSTDTLIRLPPDRTSTGVPTLASGGQQPRLAARTRPGDDGAPAAGPVPETGVRAAHAPAPGTLGIGHPITSPPWRTHQPTAATLSLEPPAMARD